MNEKIEVGQVLEYGKWILAGIAAFLNSVPQLTWFLIWLMVIDTLFGVGVAIRKNDLSSTEWWGGATRKLGSLGIVALAAVLNNYIDVAGIDMVQVATVFYIGPELASVLRNAVTLGIPVPPQIAGVMRYFQEHKESK